MGNEKENNFIMAFLEYLDLTVEVYHRFSEITSKYDIDIISITKDRGKLIEYMKNSKPDMLGHFMQFLLKYVETLKNPSSIIVDQSPQTQEIMKKLKEDIEKLKIKVKELGTIGED